uniref:Scaffolding protein n=8 Tax=unclassified Caudoviricetes TaxID=2788787 RepID=A0AB39U2K5_9CAUD
MTEQHDNQTINPEAVIDADGQTAPPEGVGTGGQENGSQAPDVNKSLKEANDRYRTERDAAREELSTAQARIERMQRAEVERLAADAGLAMGGDLFINGNAVADYLTEDGDVDAEKVAADVDAVLAERPGLRKNAHAVDPSQGRGGPAPKASEPTFADLFKS